MRDPDDQQAVAGDEEQHAADRRIEHVRHLERQALRAPDRARQVLDDQREAERQQQRVERIGTLVERPDQHALDGEPDDGGAERTDDERAPEPEVGRERVREVGADDEEAAVRHVDHRVEAQDQREPERHQRVEDALDQPVECVEQQKLHARPLCASRTRARRQANGRCCGRRHAVDQPRRAVRLPIRLSSRRGSRACSRFRSPAARPCRPARCSRP